MTWVLLWAAFVMLLTCIPYVYAMQRADGRVFGGFIWGVDEGNVYLTWMRQASEGAVFFRNQYSTAPENPRFFNLFLQLGGRVGGLLHVDMKIMFHVLRLLGGMFLLVSFYLLVAELTRDKVARWAALALTSLGSGFGWLIVLVWPHSGIHPVDVGQAWQIQPEAVTFPSLLLNGLFTTSMALMCLTFLFALRALRDDDRRAVWWGGLCLLVLGNIHTYDVAAVWLTLAVTAGIGIRASGSGRALKRVGGIVLIGLPSVIWAVYATYADPAFLAKGLTPTPASRFVDYVVAYGLVGLLALIGAGVSLRIPDPGSRIPPLWAVANALVLLIPVSFQRKMIEGLHLPLCILAGFAVSWIALRITRGLRERGKHRHAMERVVLTVCAVVALCIPSNALFVSQCLQSVKTNNAELLAVLQPPIYLDAADAAAMRWLSGNVRREDVILSSSVVGSYIPTYSPAKVWVGHWAETLALEHTVEYLSPWQPIPRHWWDGILSDDSDNEIGLRRFGDQLRVANALYSLRSPHDVADANHLGRSLLSVPRLQRPEDLADALRRRWITMVYYGAWEQAISRSGEVAPAEFDGMAAATLARPYHVDHVRIYRVPKGHF